MKPDSRVGDREGFQHIFKIRELRKSLAVKHLHAMDNDYLHALCVFVSAFGAASFAGLATLLRFAKKLSKLSVVSAMLNAGFLGLAIALIWYQNYRKAENVYGLIGICVMAGMGGSTLTDLLISILSGAGIQVTIVHERDRAGEHQHDTNDS